MSTRVFLLLCSLCPLTLFAQQPAPDTVPGTVRLTWEDDLASKMIDGIDRFLLRKIEDAKAEREAAFGAGTVPPKHERVATLKSRLGVREQRVKLDALELMATTSRSSIVAEHAAFTVQRVRWQSFDQVHGEGLLLEPKQQVQANLVAIPDAEQAPEELCRATPAYWRCEGVALSFRRSSAVEFKIGDRSSLIASSSIEARSSLGDISRGTSCKRCCRLWTGLLRRPTCPLASAGWGEGGRLALYAAALSDSVDAACVSGYFGPRERIWEEPLDRNVYGLLSQFGDAEIAQLISPRPLIVDATRGPAADVRTKGGAPYQLRRQDVAAVKAEVQRAKSFQSTSIEFVDGSAVTNTISEPALRRISPTAETGPKRRPASNCRAVDCGGHRSTRPDDRGDGPPQPATSGAEPYVRKEFFNDLKVDSVEAACLHD